MLCLAGPNVRSELKQFAGAQSYLEVAQNEIRTLGGEGSIRLNMIHNRNALAQGL